MKKQLVLIVLAFVVIFSACKKDKTQPTEPSTDVYVVGSQYDTIIGRDASGVWKNGTFTANALSGNRNHYGYAIAVSGTDVYTTGYENPITNIWKCHVWKNGQKQYSLGDGYSYGNAIAVSGTDVYVAGYAYEPSPLTHYAMLWKNSSNVSLLASGANGYQATAIAVSGNDVYVGGQENANGRLWKNGVALTLNNAAGCYITGVSVDGTDVYAVGYTSSPIRIRYWKNGNSIDIATAGTTFANAITIANGDVYIAGSDYSGPKAIAKYWKNGVAVTLGDGIRHSKANAIAIKGTDVYVTGEVTGTNNISDYATVWKNGIATTIGSINSRARAIVVK